MSAARCGTPSGWQAHKRHDEKPCDACAKAKAVYDKRWRESTGRDRANRLNAKAQRLAYRTLAHRYPDEYAEVYRTEKARLFAEAEEGK